MGPQQPRGATTRTATESLTSVRPTFDVAIATATARLTVAVGEALRRIVGLMQERMAFVEELATSCVFFFVDPETYEEKGVKKRWKDDSAGLLRTYADRLEGLEVFEVAQVEAVLRALAEERAIGAGRIIHPTRLAVSGRSSGPGLFDMMAVLGQQTCVRRLRNAAERLR